MSDYEPYQPSKWERRIDALFGLVSTKAALNRMVNREKLHWFRYLSAQPTSARRNSPSTTAGEWMKIQREKLQVMWNAIMMVENSGLCSGILIKFPTYVCGTLGWQARTGDKSVNEQYQQYIKHKTGKPGNIDISRRFTLRTQCMLDVKSIALKGDVGTNVVREDDEIYLQGVEADRIGDPYRLETDQNYVRGLELDDVGGIKAVRVYTQDRRSGLYKYEDTFPAMDKRGLPNFLFYTNPIDFDNYRGVSLFKHAIDNSTYIDRMRQYELQALLWAASQSGVYYTKSGALPEQLPFSRAPMVDESGNTIEAVQVRPNTISALSSEGESVTMFQHDRPSPNVIGMYENTVRDIAIGAGLTYGFCYNMMGLTGPAVRQCSAQDARAIQIWQEMLREHKLDPVVMLLLGDAIAKGDLPYHKNWLQWNWFFPAKPTIDVGRESDANIEEMNAGVNTGANVVSEAGLGDIQDVITQRSHEIEMMIEAAMEVADRQNLPWEQVYALMIPPPRSSKGGMAGAAAGAAGIVAAGRRDQRGATDGGIELDGEEHHSNGEQEFALKKKDDSCFVFETDDAIIEFYRPDQARDKSGKFEDEGKGSEEPGYVHPGEEKEGGPPRAETREETIARIRQVEKEVSERGKKGRVAPGGIGFNHESAEEEGKHWEWVYARNKGEGRLRSRMLLSPEKDNTTAVRLLQTMPGDEGRGYGTALLNHAKEHAIAHGASRLISDPEGGTKAEAASLFKKMGAEKIPYKGAKGGYVWKIDLPKKEAQLSGIDKKLVDYKPDRSLADKTKTVPLDKYLPGVEYTPYSKTPFFERLNKRQGTPNPDAVSIGNYVESRDKLFNEKGRLEKVALDKVVVTQPEVNKDRVEQLMEQPETGGAKPIQAVRDLTTGETYILNGHHRVAADMKQGKKSIEARVIDYVEPPTGPTDLPRYVGEVKGTPDYKGVETRLTSLAPPDKIENWSLDKNSVGGKLTQERQALHDKIESIFLNPRAVAKPGTNPQAVFVIGQPGAGKTTAGGDYVDKVVGEASKINPDDVRAHIPEYEGWNAPATQAEAKAVYGEIAQKAVAARHNIVFDETGSNTKKMITRAEALAKAGYDVHVVNVQAPLEKSAQRVWERYEDSGRFVDMDYLLHDVDHNPGKTYEQMKANKAFKSWVNIDNSGGAPKVTDKGSR